MDGSDTNWSEAVEDLVLGGETDKAISLLESIVSNLENRAISSQSDLGKLSTALFDLAKLYSTKGLSLKADQTQYRAISIQQRVDQTPSRKVDLKVENNSKEVQVLRNEASTLGESTDNGHAAKLSNLLDDDLPTGGVSDDDWETVADRAPDELFSTQGIPDVSNISLEDTNTQSPLISLKNTKTQSPKRRGRGTFAYKKQGLYSDQQSYGCAIDEPEDEVLTHNTPDAEIRDLKYGTRHVLVVADFPPSTKTTDLEKLLEAFKGRVAIRWINDTLALAVFGTPSIALEAFNSLRCPFPVRVLDDDDDLLSSISPKDLEPPRPRPKTSARAANRLIANVMGVKLPSSSFGSKELREQEEARRKRIISRQKMKDDAWGDD